MAVRLRKMARELERTPEDLLRLLRELGYDRFKSEDDMVSEPVAEQVRKLARVRPPRATWSARVAPVPSLPQAAAADGGADGDWMAGLVPGVVRVGERSARAKPSTAPPRPLSPAARVGKTVSVKPALERRVEAIATDPERDEVRRALDDARRQHTEQAAALLAARAEVDALRAALAAAESARDSLAVEVERLASAPPLAPSELPSVLQLLEERGLRGADEAERAIHALAGGRLFGRLLGALRVEDPDSLRRVLADRLVLAGGAPPDNAGYPVVTVSPARADLPSLDLVARSLGRIGELSLLNGWRRVMIVGVAPRWHALIRDGMDRRVDLTFRALVSDDASKHDVVVAWNTDIDAEGLRPARIVVRVPSFGEFLDRWLAAVVAED